MSDQLQRPFRALVFDWDGTAVENRQADASELVKLIEQLGQLGVWVVVVTGTNFGHVDRQLCQWLSAGAKSRLMVCTNRGSEVFRFSPKGKAVSAWARLATRSEELRLSRAAEAVRDEVKSCSGLEIGIVYDRLNRRKIDLIPTADWVDPPKSIINELLLAVNQRLDTAGVDGGIRHVIDLTERMARQFGLVDPRITSDVKHVELGLTDKRDSMHRVSVDVLEPEGIPWADVLIGGDEFGPIAGFAGSDDLLRQDVDGATVVSVGREPNGVPEGVVHLGGGPPRFRELLADQVSRWQAVREAERLEGPLAPWAPPAEVHLAPPGWWMRHTGFTPELEHEYESRFALSNGHLGMRASLPANTTASRPRTFVSGLYGRTLQEPPVPSLVAAPVWHQLAASLDGRTIRLDRSANVSLTRYLDLRRGVFWVIVRYDDGKKAFNTRMLHLLSLERRDIALQIAELTADEPIELGLEARLIPNDKRLTSNTTQTDTPDPNLGVWHVTPEGKSLALGLSDRLLSDDRVVRPDVPLGLLTRRFSLDLRRGTRARFERLVAFAHGDASQATERARRSRNQASQIRAVRLLESHAASWRERWGASDLVLRGNDTAQEALRFAIYHLISAPDPTDEHVSIGARALTGDAYMGHVFWDTEIFLLPFYTCTWPEAARTLLMYRYHTLSGARAKAAAHGLRGAFYAWESVETGEEACPTFAIGPRKEVIPIVNGELELHISADIAYAVWQYWQITGDATFMREAGAEIILETARFWASRAEPGERGAFHIRHVVGPDEYHDGIDDNAYTNVMASWNIERGIEIDVWLRDLWHDDWKRLRAALQLTDEELAQWDLVARGLVVSYDARGEVIEQFEGFFKLAPMFAMDYATRTEPLDVLLGRDAVLRSQIHKQADAVMLMALLPERFPPRVREATFQYYEPRSGHGSSLSPATHALVAARLGNIPLAVRYFKEAAAIDLADTMGNAALGVHIGALGGLWQAAVFGFAGLQFRPDGLHFRPHLPPDWRSLAFRVFWQGRRLRVEIDNVRRLLTVELERGRPLSVSVPGQAERARRTRPAVCRWTDPD